MEEIAETNEQPQKSSFWSGFWFPFVFVVSSSIFRDIFSFPVTWFLAGMLASSVSYLAFPVLKLGFVKYFVLTQVWLLVALVLIWFVPSLLQTVMPTFWAYALPAFLLFSVIYFVPPLDGSKRDTAWWKWILVSFIFAGFLGWFLSS